MKIRCGVDAALEDLSDSEATGVVDVLAAMDPCGERWRRQIPPEGHQRDREAEREADADEQPDTRRNLQRSIR
ncbi:MAG: hypothetical protein U0610_33005 [bacterium]